MTTTHPPRDGMAAQSADTDARVLGAIIDAYAAGTSTGSTTIAKTLGMARNTVARSLTRLTNDGLIDRDPGIAGSTRPALTVVARTPW